MIIMSCNGCFLEAVIMKKRIIAIIFCFIANIASHKAYAGGSWFIDHPDTILSDLQRISPQPMPYSGFLGTLIGTPINIVASMFCNGAIDDQIRALYKTSKMPISDPDLQQAMVKNIQTVRSGNASPFLTAYNWWFYGNPIKPSSISWGFLNPCNWPGLLNPWSGNNAVEKMNISDYTSGSIYANALKDRIASWQEAKRNASRAYWHVYLNSSDIERINQTNPQTFEDYELLNETHNQLSKIKGAVNSQFGYLWDLNAGNKKAEYNLTESWGKQYYWQSWLPWLRINGGKLWVNASTHFQGNLNVWNEIVKATGKTLGTEISLPVGLGLTYLVGRYGVMPGLKYIYNQPWPKKYKVLCAGLAYGAFRGLGMLAEHYNNRCNASYCFSR